VLAALLLLGSRTVPAVAQQAVTHNPAEVQGGNYAIDPNHTQIVSLCRIWVFSNYSGRLNGVSGSFTLSVSDPTASKLSVSVPAASFSTTSEKLDDELRSAQWFDAEKFPKITFISTKVAMTGKDTATVTGDLTLHGVTKPVVLAARFVAPARTRSTRIHRRLRRDRHPQAQRFGVTTYVPLIGDEVD